MEEYITKEGVAKIKEQLKVLKGEKRNEIAQQLRESSSQGELAENTEYMDVKEAQTQLENKIEELENTLRNAKVVDKKAMNGIAGVGSVVQVAMHRSTKKMKVRLVGVEEADITNGDISVSSPMGRAILGKKKGDSFVVETPKGQKKYKIVNTV